MNLRLPVTTDVGSGILTITLDCHDSSFPLGGSFSSCVIGTEVESYV